MVRAQAFLETMVEAFEKHEGDLPGSVTLMAHGFSEEELKGLLLVKDPRRSIHRQGSNGTGKGTLVFEFTLNEDDISKILLFA